MFKLLVSLILAAGACSRGDAPPPSSSAPLTQLPAASAALPAGMTRVDDRSQVCMVNDMFMGRAQIPVEVEGRTYFGCCPDCKRKLEEQPSTRLARDPVTGEQVDKANAVIIHDASGNVLYFTSEQTLQRYRG